MEVSFQLHRKGALVPDCLVLPGQEKFVRQALQRIVDPMSKIVGHGNRRIRASLGQKLVLLTLLPDSHRGKVRQNLHQVQIFAVKGFGAAMGDDEDRSSHLFHFPRQQDPVPHQGSVDSQDVEKR